MTNPKPSFTTIAFLYRCRRCGKIERNPHMGVSKGDTLPAVVELCDAIYGGKAKHGQSPTMLSLHSCGKNECGIADLIGFEPDPT